MCASGFGNSFNTVTVLEDDLPFTILEYVTIRSDVCLLKATIETDSLEVDVSFIPRPGTPGPETLPNCHVLRFGFLCHTST